MNTATQRSILDVMIEADYASAGARPWLDCKQIADAVDREREKGWYPDLTHDDLYALERQGLIERSNDATNRPHLLPVHHASNPEMISWSVTLDGIERRHERRNRHRPM